MRGQVVFFNQEKEAGAIATDDRQRFIFYMQDWQDVVSPEVGMTVSFEVDAQNRPRQVQLAFANPISGDAKEIKNNTPAKQKWWKSIGIVFACLVVAIIIVGGLIEFVTGEVDSPENYRASKDTNNINNTNRTSPPSQTGAFQLQKGTDEERGQYIQLLSMSDGKETIRKITINRGGCKIVDAATLKQNNGLFPGRSAGWAASPGTEALFLTQSGSVNLPVTLNYAESAKLFVFSDAGACNILEVVVDADSGSYKFTFDPQG